MKKAGSGFAKGIEIFDFCLHSASFGFAKGASMTKEFVTAVSINKKLISANIKKLNYMVLRDYEFSLFRSNSKINFINHSISLKSNLILLKHSFYSCKFIIKKLKNCLT